MNASIGHAYITSSGSYLPGEPIDNDQIENYLGMVNGKPSRLKNKILKSNGILTRHYALDKQQRSTHQNADLASAAARACLHSAETDESKIDMLAVASTQGDLPLPGLASMVQGQLGLGPMEIITTHGVCSAGMMALKSAANQVRLGEKQNALVVASELSSRLFKGSRYEAVAEESVDFEAEFLRWMLSDGAGGFLLQSRPRQRGLSLRIDWIELISYAGDYDICMSCGTADQKLWGLSRANNSAPQMMARAGERSGAAATALLEAPATTSVSQSWQDYPTYAEAEHAGALLLRQNLKLLDAIVKVGVNGFVKLINSGKLCASEIDHFLCHYSSHFFRGKIVDLLTMAGCMVPEERWFTNLYAKGNTGCASIFIMLDELLGSGRLNEGETVVCVVPESGRFVTAYMKLTVVSGRKG